MKIDMYNLNKGFRHWYLNIFEIVASHGFKEKDTNLSICFEMYMSEFIILVLYNNNVLLENIDLSPTIEAKQILLTHFGNEGSLWYLSILDI